MAKNRNFGNNNRGGYNNNNRGGNRNYNGRRNNNYDPEREEKRQKAIERNKASLKVIDAVASYLNDYIKKGTEAVVTSASTRIDNVKFKDVYDYLNEKGFSQEDTKRVSIFITVMIRLTNLRANTLHISDAYTRITTHIMYFTDILNYDFGRYNEKECNDIILSYGYLFYTPFTEVNYINPDGFDTEERSKTENIEVGEYHKDIQSANAIDMPEENND